jgi:hypothetical protein
MRRGGQLLALAGAAVLVVALPVVVPPVLAASTRTAKVQARVESTSDWTWVRFANTRVIGVRKVSQDRQARSPAYAGGRIGFSLTPADVATHAFRAVTWELSLRVTPGTPLRIGIERGCDGTTAVALYNANGRSPVRVGEVEGTGCSGVSWSSFPVAPLITTRPTLVPPPGCAGAALTDNASTSPALHATGDPNPNILVAQDNLWFHGLGTGSAFGGPAVATRTTLLTPALGFYDKNSRSVSEATIELASSHGIDALSEEWIAPAGQPGSMEDQLDGAFLQARNLCRIRWALFYDLNLRLQWKYGISAPIDFDDPRVRTTFVSDFVHFARKYFGGRYYLRLDGRPMVEIWATSGFTGDVDRAVAEARAAVAAQGYIVYLVGDEQTSEAPDPARIARWDAVTSFIPMLMPGSPYVGTDHGNAGLTDVAAWVSASSDRWNAAVSGVTVRGSGVPVSIQPGFTPQYDDVRYRRLNAIAGPTSLCATSKDDFVALARVAYAHAIPVGAAGRRVVWVGTWNNYPEQTQVEPTIAGHGYPCRNTGTDIVDALVSIFGRSTFGHR